MQKRFQDDVPTAVCKQQFRMAEYDIDGLDCTISHSATILRCTPVEVTCCAAAS